MSNRNWPEYQEFFWPKATHATVWQTSTDEDPSVRYEAKFGSEQELMEWSGTDPLIFLKHNGEWRIVSLTFEQD